MSKESSFINLYITNKFNVSLNEEWAFADSRSVEQFTHGYHRYPAKFIPQIVKKLIETYTVKGDKIVDLFAGCGTTLVESKIHGRRSEGVDINPVAQLITRVKTNPIDSFVLKIAFDSILESTKEYDENVKYFVSKHERIDYWFREKEKNKIAFLYNVILKIQDETVKDFFLCALSNILKNCSKWLQTSTKPQIDKTKKIADPFCCFEHQVRKMQLKNEEFHKELTNNDVYNTECQIKLADARNCNIKTESVSAIITSPPYVTSYEYADIHQLTGYWFEYITDLASFRKQFIGTFYSNKKNAEPVASIAKEIVKKLKCINSRLADEVSNYFNDMMDVAKEMYRILKSNGVVCLVVGNTTMKNVKINSAEAFAEMLSINGFKLEEVIRRKIPHKINPTIRDKNSGKFTTLSSENKQLVYPEEFIIIARK